MNEKLNRENKNLLFIKKMFVEYYKENSHKINTPEYFGQREFGFLLFKQGIMLRHKSFGDIDALRNFIEMVTPSDIYYSSAYYENPSAPMSEKNWLGADLVFDIDADHLDTTCKKLHGDDWFCELCLIKAKREVLKLIDIIISDFGFSPKNIRVYFTGHRGYHLHTNAKEIRELGSNERKEIVDYVTGLGLDLKSIKIKRKNNTFSINGLKPEDPGWRGRIARGIYEFSNNFKENSESKFFKSSNIKTGNLKTILKKIIKKNSVIIDPVVTIDTHRLIRLSETLHGKTGFRVMRIDINMLDDFDPFKDALAWKGRKEIFVLKAPKFRIGEEELGPYNKEKAELPTAGALLLICKRRAILKD